MKRRSLIAALSASVLAAPLFAGALTLSVADPQTNPEARTMHAVVMARVTARSSRFDTADDPEALRAVLANARGRDALTLWHLLSRTQGAERGEVYDTLAPFVKLPPREAVVRGDHAALDPPWDALGLGGASWWRGWKSR
jgi:hypothetical protein